MYTVFISVILDISSLLGSDGLSTAKYANLLCKSKFIAKSQSRYVYLHLPGAHLVRL